MNKTLFVFLLALSSFVFSACDDKDETAPVTTGTVYFVFENEIDGQPIQTGNLNYTNAAGNVYSVDELLYYISNITFVKSDGSEFKAPNYELIDESKRQRNARACFIVGEGNELNIVLHSFAKGKSFTVGHFNFHW